MEFNTNIPIYLQIIEKIKLQIVTGQYTAGEKIPAVRDLAIEFGVNPNTMQRALSELERDNLLFAERTTGRYITTDEALIGAVRKERAEEIVKEFVQSMRELRYEDSDISEYLKNELRGKSNE